MLCLAVLPYAALTIQTLAAALQFRVCAVAVMPRDSCAELRD